MSDRAKRIAENLERVRERIAAAAGRGGRTANEVRLVAVTKYVGPDDAEALAAAGCAELGESRPQELWRKAAAIQREVRWHLIGHLQRNKVRRTLPLVSLIHSIDSVRLAETIEQDAVELGSKPDVLIEVNVSREPAKHGFAPSEVEAALATIARLRAVRVTGLMCMARLASGIETSRAEFAELRQLRDRLRGVVAPAIALDELSMGMSGDFEAAIEEGATIVRVGSALFEGIDP